MITRFLLLALLLAYLSSLAHAAPQPACSDPSLKINLKGQSAVDNWAAQFDCTVVQGDLLIYDDTSTPEPITSLAPLAGLQRVEGRLIIGSGRNTLAQLTTLQGLNGLTSVGSLSLRGALELTDISALSGLTSLSCPNTVPSSSACISKLSLVNAPKLTSVAALSGLAGTGPAGELVLEDLPMLANVSELNSLPQGFFVILQGLPVTTPANQSQLDHLAGAATRLQLRSLPGVSAFPAAPKLENILLEDVAIGDLTGLNTYPSLGAVNLRNMALSDAALAPLVTLPGIASLGLVLEAMPNLSTLSGLAGLTGINQIILNRNPSLMSLAGLSSLASITSLRIISNDMLTSMAGLEALQSIADRLDIEENAALTTLDGLDGLRGALGDQLRLIKNPVLSNARALRGVTSAGQLLIVAGNTALNECDVFNPIATATGPSKSFFQSNGAGTACADSRANYTYPSITATPASHDFMAVNQGSSATVDITVTATGSPSTQALLANIRIIDSNTPAWFTIDPSSTCIPGQYLNSGDSCVITARVEPLGFGPDQADLSIPFVPIPLPGGTFGPFHVALQVLGDGQPSSNLTPSTSLDFGTVTIGDTSAPQTVTVTNTGTAPLTINSITDDDPADFPLSNGCGSTLAIGASCDVTVNFTPTRRGAISGTLTLSSSAALSPQKLVLNGTGSAPPALAVNPATLDFGGVTTGTSTVLPATVTNTGDDDLVISMGTFSAPEFSYNTDNCSGQTLTTGASCQIAVQFAPTAETSFAGTLSIASNDPASPTALALSGSGEAPATLQATPATLNFGDVDLGTNSDLPVTLTNTGGASSSVSVSAVSLNNPDYSLASDTCTGQSLAGGATCTVTVRFIPTTPGPDNADLAITHSLASSSPTTVGIVGTGGTPVAYVNPSSIDFGDVLVGTQAMAFVVTVGDSSASDLAISSVISSAPQFQVGSDTCSGQKIPSGSTCTFEVTVAATALGGLSGAVSIVSDSSSSPDKVSLLANIVAPPTVLVDNPALDFTGVAVGSSATQSLSVTNSGGQDLVLATLAISGASGFTLQSDACSGQTLAAGAACAVTVQYARTAAGSESGSLSIPSNAPQSPNSVLLNAPDTSTPPARREPVPTLGLPFLVLLSLLVVGLARRAAVGRM